MCLIAHREANTAGLISNEVTKTNLSLNPDGFGLAWRDGGRLLSKRYGPEQKGAFVTKLDKLNEQPFEFVAHFRKATHGPRIRDLAHPFEYRDPIEGRVLVFHNGIISIKTGAKESDTSVFVNTVLRHLPSRWWDDPAIKFLVEGSIDWSRLLLMTNNETVKLGDGWEFEDSVHYSCPPIPKYTNNYTNKYTATPGKWTSEEWTPSETKTCWASLPPKVGDTYWDAAHKVEILTAIEDDGWRDYVLGRARCQQCGLEGEYFFYDDDVNTKLPTLNFEIDHVVASSKGMMLTPKAGAN